MLNIIHEAATTNFSTTEETLAESRTAPSHPRVLKLQVTHELFFIFAAAYTWEEEVQVQEPVVEEKKGKVGKARGYKPGGNKSEKKSQKRA